jgi:hypothetical protein
VSKFPRLRSEKEARCARSRFAARGATFQSPLEFGHFLSAKGAWSLSPGQRLGLREYSRSGLKGRDKGLVPNIPLIVGDLITFQEASVFLLKSYLLVVRFLIVNIGDDAVCI